MIPRSMSASVRPIQQGVAVEFRIKDTLVVTVRHTTESIDGREVQSTTVDTNSDGSNRTRVFRRVMDEAVELAHHLEQGEITADDVEALYRNPRASRAGAV